MPEADKKKSREEMHLLKAEVSNETKARKSYLERLIKEANLKLNTSSGITLAGERSECLGNHTPLKPLAGQDLLVSPKDQTSSPPEATTEPRPYIPSDHWPFFEEVFMISALEEDGLDKIMVVLVSSLVVPTLQQIAVILQHEIQNSKTKIYIVSFQMALELKGGYVNFWFCCSDLYCKITAICCILASHQNP